EENRENFASSRVKHCCLRRLSGPDFLIEKGICQQGNGTPQSWDLAQTAVLLAACFAREYNSCVTVLSERLPHEAGELLFQRIQPTGGIMATSVVTKPAAKGGSFLLESPAPQDVFTPADLTDDQKLIGQTAEEFVT